MPTPPARVLLIGTHDHTAAMLTRAGFKTHPVASGADAFACLESFRPDILLLDMTLPDIEGLVFLHDLRKFSDLPVIMVSGNEGQTGRVLSFRLGADDFITQPYDHDELQARIEAVLRRSKQPPDSGVLTSGALTLDTHHIRATLNGEPISLTPSEFRMAARLARHAPEVVSVDDLVTAAWGENTDKSSRRAVFTHMLRLRAKLRPLVSIYTMRGHGFRMGDKE